MHAARCLVSRHTYSLELPVAEGLQSDSAPPMQGLLDQAKQQGEAKGMNGHATPGIQSTIPGFQVS